MKKNIFIILVSILAILVLIYLYDKRETVLNKEYHNGKENISIYYPYFNNPSIDSYLEEYLQEYLVQNEQLFDMLFIDYDLDYHDDASDMSLIFYIYQEKNNMIKKETRRIEMDMMNNKILENSKIVDASVYYDIYNQATIKKDKPMVALTFDDGPNHNTSRVLDILEKYGVKATFFILGSNIEGNEEIIRRMSDMGMEIGSHMYSHKLITKLKNDQIMEEIKRVDDLIFNVIGRYPTLLRPSYGTVNRRIKKIIDKPIIIWNVDTLDWKYHNSKKIADRVLRDVSDGDIILMHDIYRATANSLEITIPKLLDSGYQLVTVTELLYYKGIDIQRGMVYGSAN